MDIIKAVSALALAACTCAACGSSGSSSPASSSPAGPSTSAVAAAPLALSLPIAVADSSTQAYTIWPFGVHGSSHAADGHPGFDFEYRAGAPVYAPVDATVGNRIPDFNSPADRESIQLRYPGLPMDYLIDITNLMNVPSSIQPGSRVTRGQIVGTAGPIGFTADPTGSRPAMIHFGLSDPNTNEPNIAPHSVSPDRFMTPEARAQLAVIWQNAAYVSEWCEPFLDNDRAALFPKSRAWTLTSGSTPAKIVAGCPTENGATEYSFVDANGATIETGAMSVGWSNRPTTVDFTSSSGVRRLGVYDIVSETLRLSLGTPNGARPGSLNGASMYSTTK